MESDAKQASATSKPCTRGLHRFSMSAVEMDRGGGTGVIAGFFECSRTVITTCEQCSRTVFTTCEQCSRIADSDREHTKRLRSRPSPRPDFEARHVPKHNLARCIVASQVPASYNIDIHVANKLHNHELEAENSYQQRLADRTKMPLSTKIRLANTINDLAPQSIHMNCGIGRVPLRIRTSFRLVLS